MMRAVLTIAALLLPLSPCLAQVAVTPEPAVPTEGVQSDISTREISIQSNFTGIEILIFGSVDYSTTPEPEKAVHDVIMVVRGPSQPMVVRRKEWVAGLWVNGQERVFPTVPGFYTVLSSRPFRAIASAETLKELGVGFTNINLGLDAAGDPADQTFRSSLIRLKQRAGLFQENDDGVTFIGRSLFRGTIDLPVNVPVGLYVVDVYLFRDGELLSRNQSTLKVNKVGFERLVYLLAFRYPFLYGVIAVLIAVAGGLVAWAVFRRE